MKHYSRLITGLLVALTSIFETYAQAPTIPSGNITFSDVTTTSYTIKWSKGNGTRRIVTMRLAGKILKDPVNDASYTANSVFGSGSLIGGMLTANYCVYNDTGSTITVTGLTPGNNYRIAIFEYHLTPNPTYLITSYGVGAKFTLAEEPTSAPSNMTFNNIRATNFKISWNKGNGNGRIVTVREANNPIVLPTDGNGYTDNTEFGLGSNLGTGNFVCFDATSKDSVSIVKLAPGSTYHIALFEYNGTNAQMNNYLTSTYLTGTVTTNNAPPAIDSIVDQEICMNSSTQTVNLRGISNGGESGQLISITATSSNPGLIPHPTITYTSPNSNGKLYYTPSIGMSGSTIITVTVNDGAMTNGTKTITFKITVKPIASAAGDITGANNVCQTTSGVTYSIPSDANALGYSWTLPSGAIIVSGTNTNSITVDYADSAVSGWINVSGYNTCGSGPTSKKPIYVTVNKFPVANAGSDQIVCNGIAAMQANRPEQGVGIWSKASAPGSCFINDVNDSLTNIFGIVTNGTASLVWSVSNGNVCPVARDTVNILHDPGALKCLTLADFTSNVNTQCLSSATFVFTDASSGATTYTWNFGSGATPSSANTVGPHNVSYNTAGTKTVSLTINNGASTINRTINVYDIPGAAGGIISSPNINSVCQGTSDIQYSIIPVTYATAYSWSLPNGIHITGGDGTHVISTNYSDSAVSGNITVAATNSCGNGPVSSFSVTVNPLPDTSFTITGNFNPCQSQQNVMYTISGGNSSAYSWSVPIGTAISSGTGTPSVIINYTDTAVSGFITATPISTCNTTYSTSKIKHLLIDELPAAAGNINGITINSVCLGQKGIAFNVNKITGATGYSWTLPNGSTILSGNNTDSITAAFSPSGSSGNITVSGTNHCGTGKPSTAFPIQLDGLPNVSICLVTVDTSSAFNEIIWEKPAEKGEISHFSIYREKTTNVDTLIGIIPYDSLSYFADKASNPNVTSYRYRISVTDTCGNESPKSTYHRTIHLVINKGIGQNNLQWNLYDPLTVSYYKVERDSAGTGNFRALGNLLPGNNTSFSDIHPSLHPNVRYRMEVVWPVNCNATAKSYFESRSNVSSPSAIITGINNDPISLSVSMIPNPATDWLLITTPLTLAGSSFTLYNALGEVVHTEKINTSGQLQLTISSFPRGVYIAKFNHSELQVVKRLVIE